MNEQELAQQLFELIEKRKEIEKAEAKLKEHFKTRLSTERPYQIGIFMFFLTERSRTDLDKERLRGELGSRYSDFEKVSTYNVMDLKKVA